MSNRTKVISLRVEIPQYTQFLQEAYERDEPVSTHVLARALAGGKDTKAVEAAEAKAKKAEGRAEAMSKKVAAIEAELKEAKAELKKKPKEVTKKVKDTKAEKELAKAKKEIEKIRKELREAKVADETKSLRVKLRNSEERVRTLKHQLKAAEGRYAALKANVDHMNKWLKSQKVAVRNEDNATARIGTRDLVGNTVATIVQVPYPEETV